MNKQLKRWKNDWNNLWGKLPFMGRIIVGTIISFVILTVMMKQLVKPKQEEIAKLRKSAPAQDEIIPTIAEDEQIDDLKYRTENIEKSLKVWRKKADIFKKEATFLKKETHTEVLLSIDKLALDCGLRLISRSEAVKTVQKHRGRHTPKPKAKEKKNKPITQALTFNYQLQGHYQNIFAFLYKISNNLVPGYFKLDTLKIERFEQKEQLDKEGQIIKSHKAGLNLIFKLKIFHMS